MDVDIYDEIVLVDNQGVVHLPAFPWENRDYIGRVDVARTTVCRRSMCYGSALFVQQKDVLPDCIMCMSVMSPYP